MNPENESRTVPEGAWETTNSLEGILRRAEEEGDSSVVPQIQEMLRSPEVMDALGNLADRVEFAMVAAVSGGECDYAGDIDQEVGRDADGAGWPGPDPAGAPGQRRRDVVGGPARGCPIVLDGRPQTQIDMKLADRVKPTHELESPVRTES